MNNFNDYKDKILSSKSIKDLEEIHFTLFSKSGYFAQELSSMAKLTVEEKKIKGQEINSLKNSLLECFLQQQDLLIHNEINNKMLQERVDLTLPVNSSRRGLLHPLSFSLEEMVEIFSHMGFSIAQGNDIEDDWYNFSALNIPNSHPSRQEHDTFYMSLLDNDGLKKVLRTHTSNVQIRTMMKHTQNKSKPLNIEHPIKIIAPGRTYRSDSDATHSPMFHQMEGLYIDKIENISIAYLKSILNIFCNKYFGYDDLPLRFRVSYFPFTSPSFEVDIKCSKNGNSLVLGQGDDWLEVLGCGIINKNVLENCGIDSTIYSGFAFGMGIERLTMLKYGFGDLREFYQSNLKWLSYYGIDSILMPTLGVDKK